MYILSDGASAIAHGKKFKASVLFSSIFVFGKGTEENKWKHDQQSKDITVSLSGIWSVAPEICILSSVIQ